MLYLKSCPRCRKGDLYLDNDTYGAFFQCLQCGFMRDIRPAGLKLVKPVSAEKQPLRIEKQEAIPVQRAS